MQQAAAGSSFFWAMRLLPARRRNAIYAIYAFCRAVDDIADGPAPRSERVNALHGWRDEIRRIFRGHADSALSVALRDAVATFDLDETDFQMVIDGMEMDAVAEIRAPSMAELDLYCDRVAGAVGRLSVRIFGIPADPGDRLATSLGRGLQLTNILRDLAEDAGLGRLYLPRELLLAKGIAESDPVPVLRHPALGDVCAELGGMASAYFDAAAATLRACPRRAIRAPALMHAVYRRTLEALMRRGWERLDDPVRIPAPTKLWLALRHGVIGSAP